MSKIGFIIKNKSRGNEYFYLRKSIRVKDQVMKKNVYSFGIRSKAIALINEWLIDFTKFPKELLDLGYDENDVSKWLEQIKNK